MKGRDLAVAMVVALAAASACNGGKPSAFKRSPAEAGLMADAGAKKVAVKKEQEPPKKLSVVPKKTEEKPDVQPVEPNPFAPQKEEKAKEGDEKQDPYAGKHELMKIKLLGRSKEPEDDRSWYAVDEEGKRIYGQEGKKKKE